MEVINFASIFLFSAVSTYLVAIALTGTKSGGYKN